MGGDSLLQSEEMPSFVSIMGRGSYVRTILCRKRITSICLIAIILSRSYLSPSSFTIFSWYDVHIVCSAAIQQNILFKVLVTLLKLELRRTR